MPTRRLLPLLLIPVLAILTPHRASAAGCTKDSDCKGDRVCNDQGRCVAPEPPSARSSAPAKGAPKRPMDEPRRAQPVSRRTSSTLDDDEARWGVLANLLGPNALVGVGAVYQPMPWLEADVIVGYDHASASAPTATAGSVTATSSALTIMGQARFMLLRGHHAPVLEAGLGFTHYGFDATGYSGNGYDQISYARSGSPGFVSVGGGYAYRASGWFRLSATAGVVLPYTKLGSSTVTSTAGFDQADRDSLQSALDGTTGGLTDAHLYLQLSLGAAF